MADLGVRREDKNEWERRVPLTPDHVERLVREYGCSIVVQPSGIRIFPDDQYRAAGARVAEDLSGCRLIAGVKEMPPDVLCAGPAYLAFFHVIKGQPYNMPLLRHALDAGITMLDYEPIVDEEGRRAVFFGRHAGYAGMLDALWAFGQRMKLQGIDSPLQRVIKALDYDTVESARQFLREEIAPEIRESGVHPTNHPLVVGFTGGGNVSLGAQDILGELPVLSITPQDLATVAGDPKLSRHAIYKVVFRRDDRKDFSRYLPYLTMLVNGIYWEEGHDRLVTRQDVESLWAGVAPPKLQMLADLSCDVEGGIEVTTRVATNGAPVYVYDPETGDTLDGVAGRGPIVLAVDNLPAELPRSSSRWFGDLLTPMMPALLACDYSRPLEELALPAELAGAVITHQGRLAPAFEHLREALESHA
ncbi:MAG: hypothetical protein AAF481_00955 [Acidobacteriota bacterium]